MNLYGIDFGHTNYKIAFCENGNISAIYKNDYNEVSVSDDILNIIKKNDFEKILCCSVLKKSILDMIIKDFPAELKSNIKFFKPEDCQSYIDLSYKKNITRLGVDRAISLVAASQMTNEDLIVIDAGTATTIDYLDSNKVHIGGIILPSKEIIDNIFYKMLDFNFYEEDFSNDIFSKNTRSCIENGSYISAYGSINNILFEMMKLRSSKPTIYVTGGNAQHIIDNCNYSTIHVESLLFNGLMVLGS